MGFFYSQSLLFSDFAQNIIVFLPVTLICCKSMYFCEFFLAHSLSDHRAGYINIVYLAMNSHHLHLHHRMKI